MKRKVWIVTSLICLAVSTLSLFSTIVVFSDANGQQFSYNIVDFIKYERFSQEVMANYTGEWFRNIADSRIVILAVIGIAALVFSLIGILSMSLQRRNRWPFIMALMGLIGTAIPSAAIMIAVLASKQYFIGTISCGIYPIVTPIAMIVCIITVTWKRKRTVEEIEAAQRAEGLIHPAGDL